MNGCHCLCGHNHPLVSGVCNGAHETEMRFESPLTGPIDVPMCLPCVGATIARRAGRITVALEGESRGDNGAVRPDEQQHRISDCQPLKHEDDACARSICAFPMS